MMLAPAVMAVVFWEPLSAAPSEKVLLEDNFKYSGWATGSRPMNLEWQKAAGREPEFLISDNEEADAHIKLANNIFYSQLDEPLKGSFTLSAEALFTAYSRSLWIGLLRKDGGGGRAAVWGAARENQHHGQGWVQIRAVESDPAGHSESGWNVNAFSVPLQTKPMASGHADGAIARPFAKIDLHWDAEEGRWNLYVDGEWIAGETDDFDLGLSPRVYFGGGAGVLFRKITLTEGAPIQ